MNAPLPHGLIQVVSATTTELPSDPAEIIFERRKALQNFWKVHHAQRRASGEVSAIRRQQLFWRVWGDQYLAESLRQDTLHQLWLQCERAIDVTPFDVLITSSSSSNYDGAVDDDQDCVDGTMSNLPDTNSISPSQLLSAESVKESVSASSSQPQRDFKTRLPLTSDSSIGLVRSLSGGDASRKRATGTSTASKQKIRPPIARKRSSHSTQSTDNHKLRRPIIKSPRTSFEDQSSTKDKRRLTKMITSPTAGGLIKENIQGRRISAFELPSASSWQSDESFELPGSKRTESTNETDEKPSLVDKDFRGRFVETQKYLKSSTNLVEMNRVMRKTGSVVRFADEVDLPIEFRRSATAAYCLSDQNKPLSSESTLQAASESEGGKSRTPTTSQIRSWRPPDFQRHDSIGSVVAVSEASINSDEDSIIMPLPRVRSQLSLAISDLKRSRSQSEQEIDDESAIAVTSPQIEEEQEALISGKAAKSPTEEEIKLLAMGRKDGVTRAGGVNLPKELTVSGPRAADNEFEEPEQPLF